WSLRGGYRPSKDVSAFFQFREELKFRNSPETRNMYIVRECVRRHALLNVEYSAGRNIRVKSRIQFSTQQFNKTTTEGWAFVQDVSFDAGRFMVAARHALFDT